MPHDAPDIRELYDVVSDGVLRAMKAAHEALEKAGIPHALAGALAVGAYGYARASKDVDFLVGSEAFDHHSGGIVTLKPGVPVQYKGISIDPLLAPPHAAFLEEAIGRAEVSEGIPVLPAEALVCMKLLSPRKKDAADVVELISAGLDTGPIFDYLEENAPQLVAKFEDLIQDAEA